MAHRRQSIKKIRTDKRRREYNKRVLSELRTVARGVRSLIQEKKYEDASKGARELFSKLDKAAKKGILHSNTASRKKSRISLQLNALKSKS